MIEKNTFFTISYIIFCIIIAYLRLKIRHTTLNSHKLKGKIIARWTTKYIFYVYIIIFLGTIIEYFIVRRPVNFYITTIGILFYIIGILGRQWAFNSLGEFWSVNIEIRENHKLIKKGPYKYIRHPNNFFHLIEVIGIILVPNSYYVMILFLIAYLPVIILRSIIEEKVMMEKFGDDYKKKKNGFPHTNI